MSDNEYERFEISDYDLQNEFNINRRGRRATKKQQIYGVFAEDNSDDDDAGTGGSSAPQRHRQQRGGGRGGGAATKDYTAHVPFVAGGIQQSGKPKPEAGEKKDDESDNDDDDDDGKAQSPSRAVRHTSSESEDETPAHSGFGSGGMANMAGFRQAHSASTTSTVTGAKWDQHTKGIGAKLLLKMGYQPGRGLGKDLQGIAQPVQAHLRKGRGAIGAYGAEKGQTIGDGSRAGAAAAAAAAAKVDEDVRERELFQQQMHQWRKGGSGQRTTTSTGSTPRYAYKSVQDVIEKGNKQQQRHNYILSDRASAKLSNVTVIDMTGPEKRVLSGYHALGHAPMTGGAAGGDEILYEHRAAKRCDNFSMPELQHNLQLIVDLCEQDIIAIDKSQRNCADQQQALRTEQHELRQIAALERSHIEQLDGAVQLVDRLVQPEQALTLGEAAALFGQLQQRFAAEYREFGLADLAPGVVGPLIGAQLTDWLPLDEPARPVGMLREWRDILAAVPTVATSTADTGSGDKSAQHHFDPYSALVWASIIPHMRRAIGEQWDPRNHAPMARLLDAWSTVLPVWQLDNVLEQMVLPRIVRAVDAWDPLTDTVPVHQWILPWQPLLGGGAQLEEAVYAKIRVKLAAALVAWRPADRSARAMLEPWLGVFAAAPMETFLARHIIPKLQQSLAQLVINPMQQDLELWMQVAEWQPIVPAPLMASMLERHFFPKWLQTLVIWLNQAPNLDQVSRWYSGWKSQFSEEIRSTPTIKEQLNRALGLMQRTLEPSAVPPMMSHPQQQHQQQQHHQQHHQQQPVMVMDNMQLHQPPPPPQLDFRELVSQKCAERGIMFLPMPGRREQGKQVYRVGKLFCFIERAVIMLSDGSLANWAPVSLQTMLDRSCTGSI